MESTNRNHHSLILPLIVILCGLIFQLQASGVLGNSQENLLSKFWPIVIIAAGLDLYFDGKRLFGAVVLSFLGVALILLNLNGNTKAWEIFMTFWPLFLIVYGFDMLFSGKSLSSIIIPFIVIGAILYVAFINKGEFSVSSLQESFNFSKISELVSTRIGSIDSEGIKNIDYPLTSQSFATFQIKVPSGKFQLKSKEMNGHLMTGTIRLAEGESFNDKIDQSDSGSIYMMNGTAASQTGSSEAIWDLQLNRQIPVVLMVNMANGYQMVDLRDLDVAGVNLISQVGNIDVMLPYAASVPVNISTQSGDIRIFVPASVSAYVTVQNATDVFYPETYMQSGSQIFPANGLMNGSQVVVNANAPAGVVKVILNPN
ncbi:MAG TPA: DUF5668 domain-containing protein [Flexilinea sp.]|nr:DUF5668 domain-containing protein [Flexilinea sp.]